VKSPARFTRTTYSIACLADSASASDGGSSYANFPQFFDPFAKISRNPANPECNLYITLCLV
jgi:hypothetical protein